MKNSINRAKLTAAIALVLLMASFTLMAMPVQPVQAQAGVTVKMPGGSIPLPAGVTPDLSFPTIAYVSFRPNPIGVGQPLLVNMWMQPPIHVARYFDDAFLVTFTKPDGTKDVEVVDSYYGDTTAWFEYVVDQVGTWKVKFDFLGGYFPAGNYTSYAAFTINQTLNAPVGVYYKPSSDGPYDLVVQQEQVLSWPASPLPTDYWTRPVSPENREWWPILGNYPGTGVVGGGSEWPADTNTYVQSAYGFTPYVQAPNTAHIVWKEQREISGLAGGTLGQLSLTGGGSGFSIIYAGRAYGTRSKPGSGTTAVTYWQCYDLRTGELLWERPLATGESAPNLLSYTTRTISAVPGDIASSRNLGVDLMYVGGGRLLKYDPWTGAVNLNISIAPLTTGTFYANGLSAPMFLTVRDLGAAAGAQRYRLINWTIIGDIGYPDVVNKRLGIISNITWPFSSLGTVDYESGIAVNTGSITPPGTGVAYAESIMAATLTTGQLLWNITTDVTKGTQGHYCARVADHGKVADKLNDGHWHCWDLYSGKELWVNEMSSWPWAVWGPYAQYSAYGLLIYPQYDGVVAYNWTNGKVVWHYVYEAPYPYESPYTVDGETVMPFSSTVSIADGKIYVANGEHTPSEPTTRGWALHCINATTGKGIWYITGDASVGAIADGYLTASSSYFGYMYVFGKGKSATTVTAMPAVISNGATVLIQGTVLDQSPAQPGTPCVSKDSMTTYMEYLHMQRPIDGIYHNVTITGVPVLLLATDSKGNTITIGTVQSDLTGFRTAWTPPTSDLYTIRAVFAGDDSYGSSWAATGVSVGPAPTATPTPTPQPQAAPDSIPYIIGIGIAIIIAVAIVGILLFRKRP